MLALATLPGDMALKVETFLGDECTNASFHMVSYVPLRRRQEFSCAESILDKKAVDYYLNDNGDVEQYSGDCTEARLVTSKHDIGVCVEATSSQQVRSVRLQIILQKISINTMGVTMLSAASVVIVGGTVVVVYWAYRQQQRHWQWLRVAAEPC